MAARGLGSIRVGYLGRGFAAPRENKALDDTALAAAWSLGVEMVPIAMPEDVPISLLRMILYVESAAAFDELTRLRSAELERPQEWPNVLRSARFIPAVEYLQANRVRTLLMPRLAEIFRQVDVFMTPSFSGEIVLATNLTGHPWVPAPSGFSAENTPVSISFVGRLFGERELCRVAQAWQEATGWHRRHPEGVRLRDRIVRSAPFQNAPLGQAPGQLAQELVSVLLQQFPELLDSSIESPPPVLQDLE